MNTGIPEPVCNFMLVGAAKSGTTSLAHLIAGHPQVRFSKIKEPHFFSRYTDWKERLPEYHSLFAPEPGKICGEASPYYTFYPEYTDTEKRIYEYNPRMKIIYLMRNPVDRIYSNYKFVHAFGNLIYPLSEMEREIMETPFYLNRSRYAMQIKPYLSLFGAEQVLLLLSEDFAANPKKVLTEIAHFLDVDPNYFLSLPDAETRKNETSKIRNLTNWGTFIGRLPVIYQLPRPVKWMFRRFFEVDMTRFLPMSPDFRSVLFDTLRPDIQELSAVLKRDLTEIWK